MFGLRVKELFKTSLKSKTHTHSYHGADNRMCLQKNVTRIDPLLATLVRDADKTMTDEEVAASAIVQMTLFIATQVKRTFSPCRAFRL